MTAICHIAPIPLLSRVLSMEETHHLVIADLIYSDPRYLAYYQNRIARGDFVILDSAAFENQGALTELPMASLITKQVGAALNLQPSEVVLPDDMDDAAKTIEWATIASDRFFEFGYEGQMMAVPHGKTYAEYLATAKELLDGVRGVTTLGVQEEVEELFDKERLDVVRDLKSHNPDVQIHLLGVTEHALELQHPDTKALVRTCDTAKFVVWGLNKYETYPTLKGQEMPPYPGRDSVGGRWGYFNYKTEDGLALHQVRENIRYWREFLDV